MRRIIFLFWIGCSGLFAQEIRGIKLIAKDAKGIPQEVSLYSKTYAVIIGIDRYKNLDFNLQLKNAVSDAKAIQSILQEKFVFDKFFELYNENATKDMILKILQGDLSGVSDQDAVFVFFAGHGYTQATKFGDEIGYIVPYDGSMKDNEMFLNISMVELRDNIAKTMNAKHVFFVMDACYSGTLLKRGVEIKEKIVDYAYLKSITETPVRQVLTAGGKNEQVLDGGYKNHSIFTGRMIEKLEKVEIYITASELGLYIPKKVFNDAADRNHKQNPQFGNLLGEGDFVFIAKAAQNVNSEDVLAQELVRLQEQNKKLEEQKNLKAQQENLKKQEELKTQMAALEEKKKLELLEKTKKEQDQLKTMEEQKRKQELLAKIEEEKKKQAAIEEGLTYTQALERIAELQTKIGMMEKEFDEQKAKAISLAVDESPRGEFETQQEYDQRKLANKQKRKQVADEYDALKAQGNKAYFDEIGSITSKKYLIGKERLTFKLGTYNVDGGYFPVTVTEVMDLCDKNQNTANSKIYVQREDAKKLRESESILDLKATLLVRADQTFKIDKITLVDAVNGKSYEFTANMSLPIKEVSKSGTFTDLRDGETYKTIKIGNQVWMAENLNYDAGEGTYCYDDKASNCNQYGRLYTWEAANRAVPPGWHLPSKSEFEQLLNYLGGSGGNAYYEMIKTDGCSFPVLFAGWRSYNGPYDGRGSYARFWSSSELNTSYAWYLYVISYAREVNLYDYNKNNGLSIRCVKD
ncbi:caspase family protein [bacterium]|nr:caspase family protein [bacterium]